MEITATEKYTTGCTLKFPRLEKFRPDKPWYECMSKDELDALRKKNDGFLTSGKHLSFNENDDDDDDDGEHLDENGEPIKKKKKKRMTTTRNTQKATVGSLYRGFDASCVDKVGDLFADKEICVIIEDNLSKKKWLETAVAKLGGKLTQNPSKFTSSKYHFSNICS